MDYFIETENLRADFEHLVGWTLFGPGGVPGVPDGGTTAMLLGAALGALGIARRFMKA
jgi:VPDSG-CTERM motif